MHSMYYFITFITRAPVILCIRNDDTSTRRRAPESQRVRHTVIIIIIIICYYYTCQRIRQRANAISISVFTIYCIVSEYMGFDQWRMIIKLGFEGGGVGCTQNDLLLDNSIFSSPMLFSSVSRATLIFVHCIAITIQYPFDRL